MPTRMGAAIAEAERRRHRGEAAPAAAKPVNPLQKFADGYAKQAKPTPQPKPSPAQRVHDAEMQRWKGLTTTYRPARGDDGCS